MRLPRGPRPLAIRLTDQQRAILEEMVHSRRRPHDEGQRATIILQMRMGPEPGMWPRRCGSATRRSGSGGCAGPCRPPAGGRGCGG